MEKLTEKDKYLQKKIAEQEKKHIFLPSISMTDLALLSAIALFLVGSALIWFFFPAANRYTKFLKKNTNPQGDFSKPGVIVSETMKEKMSKLKNLDSPSMEELEEEDSEFFDSSSRTKLIHEGKILEESDSLKEESLLIIDSPSPEAEQIQTPSYNIQPSRPEKSEDPENLRNFVDPKSIEENTPKSTNETPLSEELAPNSDK